MSELRFDVKIFFSIKVILVLAFIKIEDLEKVQIFDVDERIFNLSATIIIAILLIIKFGIARNLYYNDVSILFLNIFKYCKLYFYF